jgi:hypothetical protein
VTGLNFIGVALSAPLASVGASQPRRVRLKTPGFERFTGNPRIFIDKKYKKPILNH